MTVKNTVRGKLAPSEVTLDRSELKRRLGEDAETTLVAYEKLKGALFSECDIKYSLTDVELSTDGEECTVGGVNIRSRSLARMLCGYKRGYLIALTLGISVDRFIKRASVGSITEGVVADAVASTLADSACFEIIKRHLDGISHTPPFAPGYGDSDTECIGALLKIADQSGYLGITTTSSSLMLPTKSTIVIVGKM